MFHCINNVLASMFCFVPLFNVDESMLALLTPASLRRLGALFPRVRSAGGGFLSLIRVTYCVLALSRQHEVVVDRIVPSRDPTTCLTSCSKSQSRPLLPFPSLTSHHVHPRHRAYPPSIVEHHERFRRGFRRRSRRRVFHCATTACSKAYPQSTGPLQDEGRSCADGIDSSSYGRRYPRTRGRGGCRGRQPSWPPLN